MNKSDIMKAAELAKDFMNTKEGLYEFHGFATALIAAAELLKQVEWQPIESAPKDGSRILGLIINHERYTGKPIPNMRTVWWCERAKGFVLFEGHPLRRDREPDYLAMNPTHFMPLPQPPVIIEKEGV